MHRSASAASLGRALLLLSMSLSPVAVHAAKTVTVQIDLPVAAQIPAEGIRRILVGGFMTGGFDKFDLQKEVSRLLRSDLKKASDFLILQDPPVNLPEQKFKDFKDNAPFFMSIAEEYRADLFITGRAVFTTADRSGFTQEEYISPVTGRRQVRTRYVERTGFGLRLDLVFVRGSDGQILYDTVFIQNELVEGEVIDPLSIFYHLAEQFREKYLGILLPRHRRESRFLFAE